MPADLTQGSVAVVGGGVSGITTALLLRLNGISTTLYTHEQPTMYSPWAVVAPSFATLHAAASILPHSVTSSRTAFWTGVSQEFFRTLAFRAEGSVRVQTHYEVFESPSVATPLYANAVNNFEMLDSTELSKPGAPHRRGAINLAGWRFDAYFCEAPTYLRYLYKLYEATGGEVFSPSELGLDGGLAGYLERPHAIYINCTGIRSAEFLDPQALEAVEDVGNSPLFEPLLDPWEPRVQRGHYIKVGLSQPLLDARERFLSYNYTPTYQVYQADEGRAADVYCYPRTVGWLLGGSRQLRGPMGAATEWVGDPTPQGMEPFAAPDGSAILVPSPIFSLNADLIDGITDGALSLHKLRSDRPDAFSAGIGYRYTRSHPEESIRLASSCIRLNGREAIIVHNYGHGGAGFTLSWGCAMDVLQTVTRVVEAGWPPPSKVEVQTPSDNSIPVAMLAEISRELLPESEVSAP